MISAVISDEYGYQALLKTFQQGSEYTDTYHMWLSLAIRYLFVANMILFQ